MGARASRVLVDDLPVQDDRLLEVLVGLHRLIGRPGQVQQRGLPMEFPGPFGLAMVVPQHGGHRRGRREQHERPGQNPPAMMLNKNQKAFHPAQEMGFIRWGAFGGDFDAVRHATRDAPESGCPRSAR